MLTEPPCLHLIESSGRQGTYEGIDYERVNLVEDHTRPCETRDRGCQNLARENVGGTEWFNLTFTICSSVKILDMRMKLHLARRKRES